MSADKRISITKLLSTKFVEMEIDGPWKDCLGERPQMSGIWLMWGGSGNGKTRGALQMAKYFTQFSDVAYYDFEEGKRKTMKRACEQEGMKEVAKHFYLYGAMDVEQMKEKMRQRKSPRIVFINSFQYLGWTKKQYQDFKNEFGETHLVIFISHAEGRQPAGKVARFVRYDADCKILAEGFKLFNAGRYGGGIPYIISDEKAREYWGEEALK